MRNVEPRFLTGAFCVVKWKSGLMKIFPLFPAMVK